MVSTLADQLSCSECPYKGEKAKNLGLHIALVHGKLDFFLKNKSLVWPLDLNLDFFCTEKWSVLLLRDFCLTKFSVLFSLCLLRLAWKVQKNLSNKYWAMHCFDYQRTLESHLNSRIIFGSYNSEKSYQFYHFLPDIS